MRSVPELPYIMYLYLCWYNTTGSLHALGAVQVGHSKTLCTAPVQYSARASSSRDRCLAHESGLVGKNSPAGQVLTGYTGKY